MLQPFDDELLDASEDEMEPISDTMAALELLRRQFPEAAQVHLSTFFVTFWTHLAKPARKGHKCFPPCMKVLIVKLLFKT